MRPDFLFLVFPLIGLLAYRRWFRGMFPRGWWAPELTRKRALTEGTTTVTTAPTVPSVSAHRPLTSATGGSGGAPVARLDDVRALKRLRAGGA